MAAETPTTESKVRKRAWASINSTFSEEPSRQYMNMETKFTEAQFRMFHDAQQGLLAAQLRAESRVRVELMQQTGRVTGEGTPVVSAAFRYGNSRTTVRNNPAGIGADGDNTEENTTAPPITNPPQNDDLKLPFIGPNHFMAIDFDTFVATRLENFKRLFPGERAKRDEVTDCLYENSVFIDGCEVVNLHFSG